MLIRLRTKIRAYFVTGLLTILPIITTIFIIDMGINFFNRIFGSPFKGFIEEYRFPGIRLIVFGLEFGVVITLIILIGLFVTNFIGRAFLRWAEGILSKLPIISKIYSAIKQFLQILFIKEKESLSSVVLVEFPRKGVYSIGLLTSTTKGAISEVISKDSKEELINVFLPTTPNPTSGFLLVVPKSEIIPLNMSVEDGIKLVVSGGIITPETKS